MLASIFGVTGLIVWIVVIVAVIALLKGKNKTLYKSDSNRMLCGICGGIGECLNIPTIIRLIWVVVTLCGGSGILAYIIAMVVMPRRVY